jgi:hypothetical protein
MSDIYFLCTAAKINLKNLNFHADRILKQFFYVSEQDTGLLTFPWLTLYLVSFIILIFQFQILRFYSKDSVFFHGGPSNTHSQQPVVGQEVHAI